MSTPRALLIACLCALAASDAEARPKIQPGPDGRPWTGYIRVPAAHAAPPGTASASSRLVYIRRCIGGTCQVHFNPVDDSRTGASSIAPQSGETRTIGDFTQPMTVWDDMMACVRATFAPFDITITDQRPLDGTAPHYLNMVGGKPTDLHPEYAGAGGVAPFRYPDCGEIPNAISYTFDVYGPDPEQLCWTVSQEVAHAFGLEHQHLQKDPMTYIGGDLPKRFRDVDAECGELEVAPCRCPNRPRQNTYRHIVGMFGPGVPTPPDLSIKYPVEGKQTQPGFTVIAKATDDVRVERVEIWVDGAKVGESTMPYGDGAFEIETPDLPQGTHTLEVRAIDVQAVESTATMTFDQGPPCTASKGCTGTDVCVDGVCVPGPGQPGGLGTICTSDTECLSHRCADAGEQFKHCVDECDLANAASCPSEFSCVPAGDEGMCWPTPSAGCCDAGGAPQGPILLGIGVGALVLRRRRRATSRA